MNYLDCLSTFFPNVEAICYGSPDVFTDIQWVGGLTMPTKAEMDVVIFNQAKLDKIAELSAACQEDIHNGFTSSALGSLNMYDALEVDQLNLIGAVAATSPAPSFPAGFEIGYAVRPIINGVVQPKQYVVHTYGQLRQVLTDGAAYKFKELINFNTKRAAVNAATTIAEINAITWASVTV